MGRCLLVVFQVVPGGIAARSGKLRMGDRILKVNGEDVTKSSHHEAVLKLLRPGDEVVLTIQHDPLPEGYQVGSLLTQYVNFYNFAVNCASYCVYEAILPVLIVSCKNNKLSLSGTEAWLIID